MAAATATAVAAVAAQQPVSAQVVGNAFVQQYYHILHHSPGLVYRFYQDISKLGRPEEDGSMSITTSMQAINEKIVSLNYGDFRAEIKSVDAQESFNGGVHVLVTGYLAGKDNTVRNFAQAFFLAPQDRGYFVLNDMFRYVDNVTPNPALVSDAVVPTAAEPSPAPAPAPAPVQAQSQENHVSEESTPSAEEALAGEVYNPPENGNVPIAEEEVPVAEVVDEVLDDAQLVVESSAKIEEVPKKSYASIVSDASQGKCCKFLSPPAAPRKAPVKSMEQANSAFMPAADAPVSSSDSVDNEHNQEADGYSIYIKGLPMNATEALLEEVFKNLGLLRMMEFKLEATDNKDFVLGSWNLRRQVQFKKPLRLLQSQLVGAKPLLKKRGQQILEASELGNNRGRFQSGRGSGFRNEGVRGRGNYGGGRGYNRGDFGGRGDFGNRGGNRGGSSNRDGYQRSENINSNGGRVNRAGGMANGSAKNITPRVSATA
ncbi:UNVERIFIED_CONTAM: Nuclear transport factor 2 [Sesamum calycinum]|uniref:Nuclear transport factor 2 n=1 Tax=Sesamum calycinum TaxID=2727403 RepID=A0AAW2SCI5_9LAMI